jgi:hypothetical protein
MSHFYVANELWAGGLNGFYASGAGDQTEKWRSTDAIFEFVKYLGNGWFLYDFTGTVAWRDSGSGGGCTWNGSGTREFGPGAAKAAGTGLSRLRGPGLLRALRRRQQFYRVRIQCGGGGGSTPAPIISQFWDSAKSDGDPRPLPFGSQRLQGNHQLPGGGLTWFWDLRGAAPAD